MAAAAAVVFAAVAAGSSPPAPPSPAVRSMPAGHGDADEAIEPGSYRIPSSSWSAADFTIAFPEGWSVQYGHIYHH